MFCYHCGAPIEEGAVFCGNCGHKVEQETPTFRVPTDLNPETTDSTPATPPEPTSVDPGKTPSGPIYNPA